MKQAIQSPSQSLRLAKDYDFPDIVRMAREFHQASPYKTLAFDEAVLRDLFDQYLLGDKTNLVVILAVEHGVPFGMIVGAANMNLFSRQKVATELVWWVDEEFRGSRLSLRLIQAYEDWATRVGASMVQVAHLDGLDLSRVYKKWGYRPAEHSHIKDLQWHSLQP